MSKTTLDDVVFPNTVVSLRDMQQFGVDVVSIMYCVGWTDFFDIPYKDNKRIARDFVIEFWSTAQKEDGGIIGLVQGKRLFVTPFTISASTKCLEEGVVYHPHWANSYDTEDIFRVLFGNKAPVVDAPLVSNLVPEGRFLFHLLTNIVTPRTNNLDVLNDQDFFLLYHLLSNTPINLPHLIYTEFEKVLKCSQKGLLPYGYMITEMCKYVEEIDYSKATWDYNHRKITVATLQALKLKTTKKWVPKVADLTIQTKDNSRGKANGDTSFAAVNRLQADGETSHAALDRLQAEVDTLRRIQDVHHNNLVVKYNHLESNLKVLMSKLTMAQDEICNDLIDIKETLRGIGRK